MIWKNFKGSYNWVGVHYQTLKRLLGNSKGKNKDFENYEIYKVNWNEWTEESFGLSRRVMKTS